MRTLIKAILPLCLLFTFAGAAAAQTPDGVPPSQETVCDGQTGAAHGLCTAYCEAMDCDSAAPQASQKACDKVLANFRRITGQDPPCVVCPCVDGLPGFIEALNGQFGLTECRSTAQPGFDLAFLVTGDGRTVGSQTTASGNNFCGFAFGGAFLFLTESQALTCNALVRQKAAAASLTCVPF